MALSGLQCPYGKVVWMYYRHLSNADTWLYPFDVRMKVPFYCDTDTCNADVSLCLFGIHDNEVWLQYSHLCDADTWHCPFGFSGKFVSPETRLSLIFEATFKRKPHEFLTGRKFDPHTSIGTHNRSIFSFCSHETDKQAWILTFVSGFTIGACAL